MFYTVTLNPALDYISQVDDFGIGKINRTKTEKILPGGKGLNVSMVLKNLGIDSVAIGFIAGFTGDELRKQMEQKGVKTEFIKVQNGITRINVKISSNQETALNGIGPDTDEKDIEELLQKINEITSDDLVILSGNIPKSIPKNIYPIICDILEKNNVTFVVDATRELLIDVLKYKPFLIKPNKEELEETFKVKITTKDELVTYAKKLQDMGAQNVLISLGGDGAILLNKEGKVYYSKAPKGKVINTVGAGDSMVAGFLAGYKKTKDYEQAFKMGIATGSASAFSMDLATAKAQAIKASKDFARSKELVAKDYIAKSTYDDTLAQRDVANANVKAATAALNDARRNYNYTRITSPIDGRIGMLNVTQGNYVSTQSGALARVVSTNPIYVTYNVDSKQFANLRDSEIIPKNKGEQPISVEVTLPDGTKYEHKGVEDFWDNQISQTTGTITLRATFANPDNRLIPGDFVKVKVYSNKIQKKVVIPQDYVLQDSTGRYVYVVDKDSVARKKYVKISNEYQKFWVVTDGLNVGDEFIGEGLVKVIADKPVVVLKDDELIKLKDKK